MTGIVGRMKFELEHRIARTIAALTSLSDDLKEEAVVLAHLWLESSGEGVQAYGSLRRWCEQMATRFEWCIADTDQTVLVAYAAVLRLRAFLILPKSPPSQKSNQKDVKLGENHLAMLAFIKEHPNARPRDVMGAFVALSDRTIKRCLKDLVDAGAVWRIKHNKVVSYRADS